MLTKDYSYSARSPLAAPSAGNSAPRPKRIRFDKVKLLIAGALILGSACLSTSAAAPATPQGVITANVYLNIPGTAVSDLTGSTNFPNHPDEVMFPPYFELWATGDISTAPAGTPFTLNNYGTQMIGYFYPASSGNYTFYLCSDDNSALYLSTDDTPGNKKLIAEETVWSNPREYTTSTGNSDLTAKDSSQFTGSQWPTKNTISLTAGKAYYIEALQKQGGGGHNLSVSIDATTPIPGSMLSSDRSSGTATVTTGPASVTVTEGQSATFTVSPNGTPPYTYQWQLNNTDIAGATNMTLVLTNVPFTDNKGAVTVKVSNSVGSTTSAPATLTVNADTTPPTVVKATADQTFTTVVVKYSEPVSNTATNAANYSFDQGVTISAVNRLDPQTVSLTTSKLTGGKTYNLTIKNVQDMAATPNTLATTTVQVLPPVFTQGLVVHEKYNNVDDATGSNISGLLDDPRFPGAPDRVDLLTAFEYPANGISRDATADPTRDYFDCIEGLFIPPTTGNYVFFISFADRCWMFLSTDESPANKFQILAVQGWSDARHWLTSHDYDTTQNRTDTSTSNQWPQGNTITLQAGKKYYMLLAHHDPSWSGGDWFAATYKLDTDPDPADGDAPKLTGSVIGSYLDPTGATLKFLAQPTNTTVAVGSVGVLTATASGTSAYGTNVTYQWQVAPKGSSTFTNVTTGTGASVSTPILALTDSGLQYRVIASVPTLSSTSSVAVVTVVADTFPPTLTKAGSLMKGTAIEVGLGFNKALDPTTATNAANYALSKGTITGVRLEPYDTPLDLGAQVSTAGAVVLSTSGLAAGDSVTVTVTNVKDTNGNAIQAPGVSKTLTVTSKMTWVQVGDTDFASGSSAVPADFTGTPANFYTDAIGLGNDTDFDLISGSSQNWNNYDEASYAYEQVTGNFDRVARVEYQDPSSAWGRTGIMARKTLDAGITRDQSANGYSFSQDMIVRVNPSHIWNGEPANNSYEWVWRDTDGGNYASSGGTSPVPYPNAWLRLVRTNQTFLGYASKDGVTWNNIGTHTFPSDSPLPDTLFVGPYYAPEFLNGDSANAAGTAAWHIGHSTVAKFRSYGPFKAGSGGGTTLTFTQSGPGKLTLTFSGGHLQMATKLGSGTSWTDLTTATSPYQVDTTSASAQFFRVASP